MFRYSTPFLLSDAGSTRASAYAFSNKSVTLAGKTHVCWLDAIAEVKARTYDHATKTWGATQHVGAGYDNHTSPALTADRDGRLRITYGPHNWGVNWNQSRFKHAASTEPHSIDAWQKEHNFGYNATYPGMVHTPWDRDAIAYRGGEIPCSAIFQLQKPDGSWTSAKEIFRQDIPPQYTHYGARLACDQAGTLYYSAHFYNLGQHLGPDAGRSYGAALVRSTDRGQRWTDMAGRVVVTPALYEERYALPPYGAYVYACGLGINSKGTLWALTHQPSIATRGIWLSRWTGAKWETLDLSHLLPADRTGVDVTMCIDTRDRIHLACTTVLHDTVAGTTSTEAWGHPSCEVYHLCTADSGKTWHSAPVSTPDEAAANWLPNLSLPGAFNPVERPTILYTNGVPGVGCLPPDKTRVFCVMLDEA